VPILYYSFDLLYLDGYDMRRVALETRKLELARLIFPGGVLRYSDHFPNGVSLFEAAKANGMEGILAKRRSSIYVERRSSDWLKIKITQSIDCVIGGYTDPEGSRTNFGALVLGLYNKQGQLIHVGQAGSGFDQEALQSVFAELKKHTSAKSPFTGPVEAPHPHWVKPALVAEIKFSEWTDETSEGGKKLRAPVFIRLREDKKPKECTLAESS
jgi:bifunctional non-homologous end joining protein LigD